MKGNKERENKITAVEIINYPHKKEKKKKGRINNCHTRCR
jgi:hypothetical protein